MASVAYDRKSRELSRREEHFQSIARLVILCLLSFVVLGAYLLYRSNLPMDIPWSELFFQKNVKKGGFQIGGVKLGMTPNKVSKIHPGLSMTVVRTGGHLGTYVLKGGTYSVWFLDKQKGEKAYRIRYDQTFKGMSETDVLRKISSKYGHPATSDCDGGVIAGARKCHYTWWAKGGVSLKVSIKETKAASGAVSTDISLTAIDSYMEGKKARADSRPSRIARPGSRYFQTADRIKAVPAAFQNFN